MSLVVACVVRRIPGAGGTPLLISTRAVYTPGIAIPVITLHCVYDRGLRGSPPR